MQSDPVGKGRYRISKPLGEGGMGKVFVAEDRDLQKNVALKFLRTDLPAAALNFFREEARLLTRLSHPNLVKIYDFYPQGLAGEDLPAGACLAMEYVAGRTLQDIAKDIAPPTWIDLFIQLAQGLLYLHNRRILHRDLKPSNVVVDAGNELKLLDFGLSTLQDDMKKGAAPLGTLAYLPPEAYWGEYDVRSDLFALGVLFYEVLTGRLPFLKPLSQGSGAEAPPRLDKVRSDLPGYFCDLIHRLLEFSPGKRPPSALSLIRFVNQHADVPYALIDGESSQAVLQKAPLVGRAEELEEMTRFSADAGPRLLALRGPSGVGRTRLLEEMKWRWQFGGVSYHAFAPAQASQFPVFLASRSGTDVFAADSLAQIQGFLRKLGDRPVVLAFTDLQDWPTASLPGLQLFLGLAKSGPAALKIVLEFSDDALPPALASMWEHREHWPETRVWDLGDLSEAESISLVKSASLDAPLTDELAGQIARNSGGRPLLILEAVRHFLQPGASADGAAVPESLKEASEWRVRDLSEGAREILALILAPNEAVPWDDATELWSGSAEEWDRGLLELERKEFLQARLPGATQLGLSHPSLRNVYRLALPEDAGRRAHQAWISFLKRKQEKPAPGKIAVFLAEHAFAADDRPTLKDWGAVAAEHLARTGQDAQAALWYERTLPLADTPVMRSVLNAHLAPLYYRLGRFEDSLQAYDRWFADRVDDETFLQKVKHRFYSGLVYYTWGKTEEAARWLRESLQVGDSEKFAGHRPYHVRVYNLLAAMEEKEGRFAAARELLQQAARYAEGMPLLLGEISQRLGKLAQLELRYEDARRHFEQTLEQFQKSDNAQAQAIARNSLGMLFLERGELGSAREHMREAVALARKSGELLQWARYRENMALVHMDRGEFSEAAEVLDSTSTLLKILGKEEDQLLMRLHRGDLALRLGNWDRAARHLHHLLEKRVRLQDLDFWDSTLLLMGEWAYLSGRFARAREVFLQVVRMKTRQGKLLRRLARVGLARVALRLGEAPPPFDEELPRSPHFDLWKAALHFLSLPSAGLSEERLLDLLQQVKAAEKPETRLDLYRLLAQEFERRDWNNLSKRIELAAEAEFAKMLQSLPEELKMDFEKNRDLKSLDQALGEVLPAPQSEAAPTADPAADPGAISENRFRQYSEINRQIAQKTDLNDILERVMDAAIELTGAERGFVLLKSPDGQGSLLKGFEVRTARHINQKSLNEGDFQFSMTAIQQAVDRGAYLLTDNAQLDPRLQEKTSVMQFQLKSILVVPLELEGQILGAIYLDHRYQPNCFAQEDVVLLNAFASQAALAIQKAQMMAELKKAKELLEVEVKDQARHIEVLTGELAQMRDDLRYEYTEIIGQSPPMMQVFQLLDHVTETTIPVWVLGESGTGKELIARSLHFNSPRKGGAFVSENVSAIPETLLESELFGHKKGAFTHADRDRVGLFEQAHGGTLFLDEIADMSLAMQAKLLRVLQEGEVRPLGSGKKIRVDVRLVTASNRDLNQMVRDEKFRQDLFFRINGLTIKLPPLRERKDDIPLLVNFFIKKISKEYNLQPSEVQDEAYQTMFRYPWPGNIRELEGVIRNALLFAKGRPVTSDFLSLNLSQAQATPAKSTGARGGRTDQEEQSEERQLILDALRRHEMDKEKVAGELGISLRSLYTRLEKLGIPKKKTLLAKYLGL